MIGLSYPSYSWNPIFFSERIHKLDQAITAFEYCVTAWA